MKPIKFKEANKTYAETQPEYLPLPVYEEDGKVVCCWKLSVRERIKVLLTGRIWNWIKHCQQPLQPHVPVVDNPFKKERR